MIVIFKSFNQETICIQKFLLNRQCKNRCSRDSSSAQQNVHKEVSDNFNLYKSLLVYTMRLSNLYWKILVLISKVTLCGIQKICFQLKSWSLYMEFYFSLAVGGMRISRPRIQYSFLLLSLVRLISPDFEWKIGSVKSVQYESGIWEQHVVPEFNKALHDSGSAFESPNIKR